MNITTLAASTALAVLLAVGGPASARPSDDTYLTHSKQMKNDLGIKEGEARKNAAPESVPETQRPSMHDPNTHCTHSKAMKNAGMKEGECWANARHAGPPPCSMAHERGHMHRLHTKQMKQDRGVKDGEPMEDAE